MPKNYFTVETERAGGAVVATHQFEVKSDQPVHEFFMTMKFLEVTDLPTIAQVLTQFATTITVKSGGAPVFSMSATDLWHFMNIARPAGLAAHQSDGTGADNHVMAITLPIPLGPIGVFDDVHPDYGLNPKDNTVVVEIVVPADSEVDNRKYTLGFLSVEGKMPKRVISRITRNITAAATGDGSYIDLPSGSNIELTDLAFFQTTALTAGTTTDAVGITSMSLEINQTEAHLQDLYSLMLQGNLRNLSQSATSPHESATYGFWNPNTPNSDDYSIPLPAKARLNINAGVAEALRFFGGIARPN